MNGTKPKFTFSTKDIIYAITLIGMIITFFVRFALLEAKVEIHEEERKLYNVAVIASDIDNIKDDVAEIKRLVEAL